MIGIGNPWVDPRVYEVSPEAARAYMLKRGWKMTTQSDDELWVFAGPLADNGEPIIQILPTSAKMRAYPLRIEELVCSLSILEDRHPRDVLGDMLMETPIRNVRERANGSAFKAKKKPAKRKA